MRNPQRWPKTLIKEICEESFKYFKLQEKQGNTGFNLGKRSEYTIVLDKYGVNIDDKYKITEFRQGDSLKIFPVVKGVKYCGILRYFGGTKVKNINENTGEWIKDEKGEGTFIEINKIEVAFYKASLVKK